MKDLQLLCKFCGTVFDKEQGWYLTNYYGFSGYSCQLCYNGYIAHDSFGKPKNPKAFLMFHLKYYGVLNDS